MPLTPAAGTAIATGVSALAEMANSYASGLIARKNTNRTIAANKELAEYQYSKDLEMWNKGNQYNTPAAQMERIRSAGLNPNLIYGSGSVAGNTTGQLPKYNAPTVKYEYQPMVRIPEVISTYQNLKQQQAQTNLIQQNAKNAEVVEVGKQLDNLMKSIQSQYWAMNAANQAKRLGFETDLSKWKIEGEKAGIRQKQAQTAFTLENTKLNKLQQSGVLSKNVLLNEQARQAQRLVNLQLDNLESSLRLKNAEYPLKMQEYVLKMQQEWLGIKKGALLDKEAFYYPYRNPWSLIGGAAEGIDLLQNKAKEIWNRWRNK